LGNPSVDAAVHPQICSGATQTLDYSDPRSKFPRDAVSCSLVTGRSKTGKPVNRGLWDLAIDGLVGKDILAVSELLATKFIGTLSPPEYKLS
jgi:hypothetical protein